MTESFEQFEVRNKGYTDYGNEKVLKRRHTIDGDLILVQKKNLYDPKGSSEYVTWWEDKKGNRFWGHYMVDYEMALDDFENR